MSSAPLASQTQTDHRAGVWVTTLICIVFIAITLATRIHVRWNILGLDDYIITAASSIAMVQFAIVIVGLAQGLGEDTVDRDRLHSHGRLLLASETIFIVTVFLVKSAVVSTIERLLARGMKSARLVCYIFQGLLLVGFIASITVITARCAWSELLTSARNGSCAGQTARWIAVSTIDGLTEVSIFGGFCWIIHKRQMTTSLKLTVIAVFGLRLGCPVFMALHAAATKTYTTAPNPGTGIAAPLVWQQIAMTYALLSALVIALKGFLASFDMGFGMEATYGTGSISKTAPQTSKRSHAQSAFRSQQNWELTSQKANKKIGEDQDNSTTDESKYSAQIYHPVEDKNERDGSIKSGSSQRPIIRYEVQYSIQHEDKDNKSIRDSL